MRKLTAIVALSLVCVGCPPNVQQHAGFERAVLSPRIIEAPVGQLVRFDVLPPVTKGTRWSLDSHGLARFVGDDTGHLEWVAETTPIRMEAMVAPALPQVQPRNARKWLWFALNDAGESQSLDLDLPVRALPFREIAPVTFQSVFSLEPRTERLSVKRTEDRVIVTYRTPIDQGAPLAPSVGAMLLETGGRKILYAEARTNFGERAKERIGYDVTFSYSASVGYPVEVVLVEWIAHGLYSGPFEVHRLVVGAPTAEGAPRAASGSPAASAPSAPTQ